MQQAPIKISKAKRSALYVLVVTLRAARASLTFARAIAGREVLEPMKVRLITPRASRALLARMLLQALPHAPIVLVASMKERVVKLFAPVFVLWTLLLITLEVPMLQTARYAPIHSRPITRDKIVVQRCNLTWCMRKR